MAAVIVNRIARVRLKWALPFLTSMLNLATLVSSGPFVVLVKQVVSSMFANTVDTVVKTV